jgi:hypothetical protein
LEDRAYPQADYLRRVRATAAAVVLDADAREGLKGPEIARRLRRARLHALQKFKNSRVAGPPQNPD